MNMEETKDLERKLMSKDEQLRESALIGKDLLDKNQELQTEKVLALSEIEDLKALNFSLDRELKVLKACQESLESDRQKLQNEFETKIEEIQKCHKNEITFLKDGNRNLREGMSELQEELAVKDLNLNELQTENKSLEAKVEQLETDLNCESSDANTSDISRKTITVEFEELQKRCNDLNEQLEDKSQLCKMLKYENEKFEKETEELDFDKRGLVKATLELNNKVAEQEGIIINLNAEIDIMRLKDVDRQGNSLFAEVEDRRIETHSKLTKAEINLKAMQQRNDQQQNYILQLQSQIRAFPRRDGSDATKSYISKMRCEMENLMRDRRKHINEINYLEKKLVEAKSQKKMEKQFGGGGDESTQLTVAYYQKLLQQNEEVTAKLKFDLAQESLILTGEIDERMRLEKRNSELVQQCNNYRTSTLHTNLDMNYLKLQLGKKIEVQVKAPQKFRVDKIESSPEADKENKETLKETLKESE